MSFANELRTLLRGVNLSSPNGQKWDPTKELVKQYLGVPEELVYCTYLGKATQAQVRLGKQIRADVPYRIALAFGGDGKRDSASYQNHARRALEQFPSLEAVVVLFEEGSPGSGQWLPERLYVKADALLKASIESWNPGMEVEERPVTPVSAPAAIGATPQLLRVESTLAAEDLTRVFALLSQSRNVLLKGVPGVGKTYLCRALIDNWDQARGRSLGNHRLLVLHPSSTYEDLIEGLRPVFEERPASFLDSGNFEGEGNFAPSLGRITEFVREAAKDPERDYLLVLDEINRTNLAGAFGEFLLLVEATKRANFEDGRWRPPVDGNVALTYSGRSLFVPDNLFVVATMNTSDRSISPMDRAMARRFESVRLEPLDSLEIRNLLTATSAEAAQVLDDCASVWERVNDDILYPYVGPDALVGHASILTLVASLNHGVDPEAAAAYYLESALLSQVIQLLSDMGQEDLLFPGGGKTEQADATAELLQVTLNCHGLELALVGVGLGRRLVVSRT